MLEIVFVPGWMIVNSCRLEQLCISLQNTKFVVWAEILMLQTQGNVSNSRVSVAGMIVWTAEAYCCKSCASLPWCTLVAWHKHPWVQLRKTGNGSGMLARKKSSYCPFLAYLCVSDVVALSIRSGILTHRSLFTPHLRYQRRPHWGVEDTSRDIGFHRTGSWSPKVDWLLSPYSAAGYELDVQISTQAAMLLSVGTPRQWFFPESILAEYCMHLKEGIACTSVCTSRRYWLTCYDWWRWLTEASAHQNPHLL